MRKSVSSPSYLNQNHWHQDAFANFDGTSGYRNETKRLYGVLEIGLTDRDWLVGSGRGKYSIADINVLPWVLLHEYKLSRRLRPVRDRNYAWLFPSSAKASEGT